MKHIFIVNPSAGKYSSADIIGGQLSALDSSADYEIYATKGKGDAEKYIKSRCETDLSQMRFYACGGDGTVSEVVNGAALFDNASFSVFPCGSGNDFVKCFGNGELFLDVKELVNGTETEIDLIRVNDRLCVNVCHFGFDTCVAQTMNRVKAKPIIGGGNAYTTGVVYALISAMKNKAEIIADGEKMNKENYLLCTVANGNYVGGRFKCAPHARVDDGFLDICLVDPVSRFTFVKLVGAYAEGKHLDDPRFRSFVHYKRCKKVEINGDDKLKLSLDGEIVSAPHFSVEVLPKAIKIALPQKLARKYAQIKEEIRNL